MNINGNYSSIEQITATYLNNQPQTKVSNDDAKISFEEIFRQKSAPKLKFSKHAGARLEERNISLTDEQMERLESATERAGKKGIRDSLMLMDNMAFIVNVKSSTVITAMDRAETKDNIFTNIDGAVIA